MWIDIHTIMLEKHLKPYADNEVAARSTLGLEA